MKNGREKLGFPKIILLSILCFMPTLAWAAKTVYYFTEPAAGRAGYGYSPESACASVNVSGGGTHKGTTRTIETKVGNNNSCSLVMTDTNNKGEARVTQLIGKIHRVDRDCNGNLDYSIYSNTCINPAELKQQIAEKETINNPVNNNEHLIG